MAPRLVLVDDHEDHREALALHLEDRGYQVVGVGSASALRNELQLRGAPALILLDRGLPDASGDELLAELRAGGVACPVVILSGREPQLLPGAQACLGKPVDIAQLERLLERLAPAR